MRTTYVRGDFIVCPNPLSADSYSCCEYNCRYCFLHEMYYGMMKKTYQKGLLPTDLKELERILKTAFGSRKDTKNPTILALRENLPVIIGRKCEPLCPSEAKYHNTAKMTELFNDHGVKAILECKGADLYDTEEQSSITDNATGFLMSIIPATLEDQHKLEPDSPGSDERFNFAESLKEMGLWVGLTAEPLLPTIADKPDVIESYANRAWEIHADHVNFGEYRSHIAKVSQKNLAKVGISLRSILQGMQNWFELGTKFMKTIQSYDIKCSTPDWVNFGFLNDCEGCCGLDEFGTHKTTMQHAVQILKKNNKVYLKDIIDTSFPSSSEIDHIAKIWNGDKKHFNLSDIKNISEVGTDEFNNKIYGKTKQKSIMEL